MHEELANRFDAATLGAQVHNYAAIRVSGEILESNCPFPKAFCNTPQLKLAYTDPRGNLILSFVRPAGVYATAIRFHPDVHGYKPAPLIDNILMPAIRFDLYYRARVVNGTVHLRLKKTDVEAAGSNGIFSHVAPNSFLAENNQLPVNVQESAMTVIFITNFTNVVKKANSLYDIYIKGAFRYLPEAKKVYSMNPNTDGREVLAEDRFKKILLAITDQYNKETTETAKNVYIDEVYQLLAHRNYREL